MNLLTPQLVKRSLSSHSWLGLVVGGLMYIICLSGTISIFYEEVERWEHPHAEEYTDIDPAALERAFNEYMSSPDTEMTEHMYLIFPNDVMPRGRVSSDLSARFVNRDGSLGDTALDEWSELLTGLHINLHMPVSIGVVVVSAVGALLCGLIISGFLAHPSIVKDAFKLRSGSSGRMGQVDLHNRLSVWGAPFHLMIAITGAFYGLAFLMLGLFATTMDGATPESVLDQVFPPEPALENQAPVYGVARALEQVRELSPDGKLLYLIVHDAPTESRFIEFYVQKPELLAWSETYWFDTAGNYLKTAGYTEGDPALQALYSVYRIHFGHFGGFFTKVLYVVLGLALTVVSATGINIWLEKRKYRDALNLIWPGVVWGMPLALAVAGLTQAVFHIPSVGIFWGGMVLTLIAGLFLRDERKYKQVLQGLTGLALLVLVCAYTLRFGSAALSPAGLPMSAALLGIGLAFLYAAYGRSGSVQVFREARES